MATEAKRSVRVAARLHEEIAFMIARTVRDPRIRGVVVSRVEMPDDLRNANVYVRMLEGGEDEARKKDALVGLNRAAAMMRREATRNLSLRYAPELRFFYDANLDQENRIEQLLHEVKEEEKSRTS